jgi:hypothetical protein
MAISGIETLCPHRYAASPGTGVLTVHTRLLLTSATDGPEEAVQLTLVVVDMFDTERSRGALAMEAAAWLEGQVTIHRTGQEVSLHAIGQQCRSDGGEYLLVVVWVPHERLPLLHFGDYVPGVGLPGLPTGCIVVTDKPGAVPHASVDILVGTRLDPIADAARVTRMASSLHASETLTCADIFDFSHALSKGSHAVCVDAFWCESTPDVLLFGSPRMPHLLPERLARHDAACSSITEEPGSQTCTSGIAKLCAVGSRLDFSHRDRTAGRPTRFAGSPVGPSYCGDMPSRYQMTEHRPSVRGPASIETAG